MQAKPYPKYKPSGVDWLGDVPEHWEAKRLKYSASINDEALPDTTLPDFEFKYVDIGGVNAVDGITATEEVVFENAPSRARRKVRHGDTIVSTVRTYLRAIAPIKNPPENLIVSTGFAVVRPRKVEPGFLAYALRESSFIESVVARSTGVSYPACNASEVSGIAIPLPTPAEQRSIASYLDRETGRLDRLVAKKRELIERLKEKRTALISRTVTRGLPPAAARAAGLPENPHLKSSGHPWLDDIPQHWEVKRLKEVSVLFGRIGFRGYSTDDLVYEGEGAISMSPSNMSDGVVSLDKCTWLSWEKYHESPEIQVQPEDVIMVKTGSTLGKTAFVLSVPVPMTVNPQLMIFKEVKCSKRFLFYYVFSKIVQDVIPLHNTGSTIPTMTQEGIGKLPFPHPPLPEQAAIAAYLDVETAKLDSLVGKVEEAVERLQEYRTALITAAVTGKIDVRNYE
ncbi:MAG: restriction endonuclease subunit S [Prosthecobacter sp.]|uniref:restriction endonuclease subunit S n=1 Tax=Prosthecobacter sp. TaxID=1965333 RepID=UPI0039021C21